LKIGFEKRKSLFLCGPKNGKSTITGALTSIGNGFIHANLDSRSLKVAASAVLGGTVDEIGGGKFANGAITGAYGMLFNEMQHDLKEKKAANSGGKFPTLTFDGNQLSLFDEGKMVYSVKAYSGRPLENGTFDYSIARQKMKGVGPIPEGTYFINGSKIQTMSTVDAILGLAQVGGWPGGSFAWGEQRAWITPLTGTNTYGRGGFSIHGGYEPGSAGCIDLVGNVVPFFNNLQRTSGGNGMIMLNVRY
jgi:hypothetical protein